MALKSTLCHYGNQRCVSNGKIKQTGAIAPAMILEKDKNADNIVLGGTDTPC